MKAACILLLSAFLLHSQLALSQRKRTPDSVDVTIRLNGHRTANASIDSVFIYFDRYDHTGAGIIKKIYYPKDNEIVIPQVPEGRYFIAVYCLGAHWQYFNDITFINKRHSNNLEFNLKYSDEFVPGNYNPHFKIDFNKLSVTGHKKYR